MLDESDISLFSTIKAITDFSELSKEIFDKVRYGIEEIEVNRGDRLIKQGQQFHSLYILIKGKVEIKLDVPGKKTMVVATLSAPDVLGVIAAVLNTDSTSEVVAVEHCKLISINRMSMNGILHAHPSIAQRFKDLTLEYIKKNLISEYLSSLFNISESFGQTIKSSDLEFIRLERDEVLFHANDPSDKLYFVVNGRLRASRKDSHGKTIVIGDIFVGETIGEIGVYSKQNRLATIHALRNSLLLSAPAKIFHELRADNPQMSDKLLDLVMMRISRELSPLKNPPPPKTIAIVGALPNSLEEGCARALSTELNRHGKAMFVDKAFIEDTFEKCDIENFFGHVVGEIRIDKWLSEKEKEADFLLLIADGNCTHWTQFCLDNADAIVIIAQADSSPELRKVEKIIFDKKNYLTITKRLVLLRPKDEKSICDTSMWLHQRKDVNYHHHIRWENKTADIRRLARFLTNTALGIVLGGGGARGGAHIGILKALKEANIEYDYVGGTSMGAIIGFLGAQDSSNEELEQRALFTSDRFTLDFTFPFISLAKGEKLRSIIEKLCGKVYIEDFPIPFFAISSNLSQAKPIVHKRGLAVDAVLCSIAIPGVFPPQIIEGDIIVDGGVLNNLPIDVMKQELQGGRIICINVSLKTDMKDNFLPQKAPSGWQILFSKLLRKPTYKIPNIFALLQRTSELASIYNDSQNDSKMDVDLFLRPPIEKFNLLDMTKMRNIIDVGYQYAKSVLEKIKNV